MKYDIDSIKRRKEVTKILVKTTQYIAFILTIVLIYNIILVFKSKKNNNDNNGILGYNAFIITTNSMSPQINQGDLIITTQIKEKDLVKNQVITFKRNEEIITHRIIEIQEISGSKRYITKGDNNNVEDLEKILYSEIEGVQIFRIPYLGKLIILLQNSTCIFILIILLILIYCYLKRKQKIKRIRREKKKSYNLQQQDKSEN